MSEWLSGANSEKEPAIDVDVNAWGPHVASATGGCKINLLVRWRIGSQCCLRKSVRGADRMRCLTQSSWSVCSVLLAACWCL